jgi:hypothetical protein
MEENYRLNASRLSGDSDFDLARHDLFGKEQGVYVGKSQFI